MRIKIKQPARTGDIIICLPIAKYYYDQGHEIVWPVFSEYMSIFNNISYVTPIDSGNWKWPLVNVECDMEIDVLIGLGDTDPENTYSWRSSGLSFDAWKYKKANVPIEEKFKLSINRNLDKENEYRKRINAFGDYYVKHSGSTHGKTISINGGIELIPIQGYNIFDCIGAIESASKIYCGNSSIANLVNGLGLCKNRRFINLNYGNNYLSDHAIVLDDGWEII